MFYASYVKLRKAVILKHFFHYKRNLIKNSSAELICSSWLSYSVVSCLLFVCPNRNWNNLHFWIEPLIYQSESPSRRCVCVCPSFLSFFGIVSQLRRFDVAGIHKSSITALAWSPNGMKLFSGDDRGKIVYSALDLDHVKDPYSNLQFSRGRKKASVLKYVAVSELLPVMWLVGLFYWCVNSQAAVRAPVKLTSGNSLQQL